jgi:hypothetical protein
MWKVNITKIKNNAGLLFMCVVLMRDWLFIPEKPWNNLNQPNSPAKLDFFLIFTFKKYGLDTPPARQSH